MISGSCLCGGVAWRLDAETGPITACHCTQCRKFSGHHAASFDVDGEPDWTARDTLREFAMPGGAVRYFCGTCGASIGFRYPDGALSLEAGQIDGPSGGRLAEHIFVADKGDYYDIADGLPQKEQY